jgi:uncharacterized protein (DUF58 family)
VDSARAPLFDSDFLAKLEQLHLLARRQFRGEQRAERRSRQTGASLEFADYREYTPGDELRSIDWAAYGRFERLFVKLYEQELDLPVTFLIDVSASMRWQPSDGAAGRTKSEQARRIAAALGYIALANLDAVTVAFFGNELQAELGVTRGKGQFHRVLEFLAAEPEILSRTDLARSLQTFARRTKRRGLVFVLSDFFDAAGYEPALSQLRHAQFEVHALQVLDPAELAPRDTGDLRLRDTETGELLDVTVNETLLQRYREEIARYNAELAQFCVRRGIVHATILSDMPFQDVVLRALRDGVMLR